MIALAKAWNDDVDNIYSNQADQHVQYDENFFNFKLAFVAAGWDRIFTCNGSVANANDNLPNATSVVHGLDGSQPISYFVYRSPAGWSPGGQLYVSVYTNESNADATPQTIGIRMSTGAYALHGTPLSNRPVASGTEVDLTTLGTFCANFIPWAAATGGAWSWWTASGDIFFATKVIGESFFRNAFWLSANQDNVGGGHGNWRLAVFMSGQSAASDQLTAANLQNSALWRGINEAGSASVTSIEMQSEVWAGASSWTGGADPSGRIPRVDAGLWVDIAGAGRRYMGRTVDVYACPQNAPFGELEDGDTVDPRRLLVIGDIWMPTNQAQATAGLQ